jgi:hypothetical protein
MPSAVDAPTPKTSLRHELAVGALLALAVLVFQWGSLWDGVRHDDHLHRQKLRTLGWSWHDLIESTTFDFPGHQMSFWWQQEPAQWRYPRPLKMLIMKTEFVLVDGWPVGMHAFSLMWHWLCTLAVYRLCRWVLASWRWALLVTLLFVINPNGALAVSWTAAHDTLISTFLLVAAVYAYARASFDEHRAPAALRWRPWVFAVLLWVASLFARESTIVFPALALALDLCFGGRGHAWRRRGVHLTHVGLALVYLAWRFWLFPTGQFPGGYLDTPASAGYVLWAFGKWIELAGLLLIHFPLHSSLDYVQSQTAAVLAVHFILFAAVVAVPVGYVRTTRGAPGRWFGPLWLLLCFAPVVPIASMPHFAYLPFVGYAISIAVFLAAQPRPRQRWLAVGTAAIVLVAFGGHRLLNRAACRAEQLIAADILSTTPSPRPGSNVFFINLPLPSSFTMFTLREAWGVDDIDGYALTLASQLLRMDRPSTVKRISPYELVVSTEPPGYFTTVPERYSLKITGAGVRFEPGMIVRGKLFDATVLEMADGGGVTKLKFTFHEPLDRSDYYFYVSTPERPAYRLRFDPAFDAAALAAETARFRAEHAQELAERDVFQRTEGWLRRK